MADGHVRWVLDQRHDLSATGRYTSLGDVVSLPCINGKPGIHPPKEKGDEGERYLERGGEVRVRDRKRVVDYLTSQTRIRATTLY